MIGTLYNIHDFDRLDEEQSQPREGRYQRFLKMAGFEQVDEARYRELSIAHFAETGYLVSHESLTLSYNPSREPLAAIIKPCIQESQSLRYGAESDTGTSVPQANTEYWIKSLPSRQSTLACTLGWIVSSKLVSEIMLAAMQKNLLGLAKKFQARKAIRSQSRNPQGSNQWHEIRLANALPLVNA